MKHIVRSPRLRTDLARACGPWPKLVLVLLIITALLIPIAQPAMRSSAAPVPAAIQYGDLSFDPYRWKLIENGDTLMFVPNGSIANQGHLKVGPTSPATSNLEAFRNQIWARLSAGQTVSGSSTIDGGAVDYGGNHANANFSSRFSPFRSGACAGVMVIQANGKFTPFEMTIDTNFACGILYDTFGFIKGSLKVRAGGPITPPPLSTNFNAGSPSDQGPDPYDSIDWDGPDEFTDGIYDDHPINPKTELKEAALLNGNFIGIVQPKQLTFNEALANVRVLLDNPQTKAQYDELKKQISNSDPFMLRGTAFVQAISGDPISALVSLLAAYELYPNDPDSLVNLAAMLAHCGLPNESLAVLKQMEDRSMKPQPSAFDPNALMEYLKGFDQLLIGQAETGKYHLHQAITLDPFLKEASLALALAQKLTGQSEEAEKTYIQGVWRRRPTQTLHCGGTGHSDDDPIRPPITDLLDVSHGKPGVLPQFDHPSNFSEALGLLDRYKRAVLQVKDEDIAIARETDAIYRRISARKLTADEKYAQNIDFLRSTLDVNEPVPKKLQAAETKARDEADAASVRIAQRAMMAAMPIMMQPGNHASELQAIATDAVGAMRPFAQAYDQAVRRHHKTWYRYATGLATHLGDADWHRKEDLAARIETNADWAKMVIFCSGWYAAVAAVGAVKDPSGNTATPTHGGIDQCPPTLRDIGVKIGISIPIFPGEKVSLSMKFTCDKKTVEVGYNPLDVDSGILQEKVGVFGQLEFARKGGMTIAVGVKGSYGVMDRAELGARGCVYVTSDAHGNLTDGGFKGTVDASESIQKQIDEAVSVKRGSSELDERTGSKVSVTGVSNLAVDFIPSLIGPARGPDMRRQ